MRPHRKIELISISDKSNCSTRRGDFEAALLQTLGEDVACWFAKQIIPAFGLGAYACRNDIDREGQGCNARPDIDYVGEEFWFRLTAVAVDRPKRLSVYAPRKAGG